VVLRDTTESPDYFLDWAFDEVKTFAVTERLPSRSLIVRTTLDPDLQRASEEAIEFFLRQNGKQYNVAQSAVVLMENTGAVRAIVGGRDYGESQFNRATRAERQAGSSFKPYVYAAAIEEGGMGPEDTIVDGPVTWRGWSPQNYNRRYSGRVTLANALARSINTIPVRLARDVLGGTAPIVDLTKRMGITSPIIAHHTMVLGTSGITVLDQATGYLTFASGGYADRRHAFTRVAGPGGEELFARKDGAIAGTRVLSEATSLTMNRMLANVPAWGTGRRAALTMTTAAGKTGTTQSYRDAWFVGYTGNFTAAVWYGNDNYSPTNRLTGGSLPAMTWQRIMTYAHQGIELQAIPGVPQPEIENDGGDAGAVASADDDENGLGPRTRPRILSKDTATFLRWLGQAFENADPLDLDSLTVASTDDR
jgi:penicillin-binding protein 1A